MNTNENILWFDSDIVGFLELLNDIEWLFQDVGQINLSSKLSSDTDTSNRIPHLDGD